MSKRADWARLIVGSKGSDELTGTAGRDVIVGRKGADVIEGGAGNDTLIGDDAHWGWHHCMWWKPRGSFDDYLDGGAGSDYVLAGRGNDIANYTLADNSRAHDVYDGGRGFDTLRLTLTHAELQLASVQEDIAAFEAFLARKANPNSDHGRTFEFKSFNLDVRNFEALEIQVVGGNTAPVARNDAYSLDEDSTLQVAGPGVAGNDSDAQGSALRVTMVAGPAHGTLSLGADGSFTYAPDAGFNGGDSFTYKVNDGELDSEVATVLLQVAAVNDAPVAAGEAFATDEDIPLAGNVLGNDTDPDADALTAHLGDGPAFGELALNPDGTFTYSPDADFSGTDTFTYWVSDGSLDSAVVSVELEVASVNDTPVAAEDAVSAMEDEAVSGNVTGNDVDADGDTLAAVLLSGPSHGELAFAEDGSFTYAPEADFNGTDSFTYQVSDGQADSGAVTVTLAVAPVNDAPVANDDALPERAYPGVARVAVIGGSSSSHVAAALQLEDNPAVPIDADAISATAFRTQQQWATLLEDYDAVVLGDSGFGTDYSSPTLFPALREFVDAGGGVVTTGWFAFVLPSLPADANYITPIGTQAYRYAANGSSITVVDATHPITAGIAGYRVNAAVHELAGGIDAGATILARGIGSGGVSLPALVVDDVGLGRTAYFGSLQMANAGSFSPDRAIGGTVDQLFERVVAWAAGSQEVQAATDEDTPLQIAPATLLANDGDVDDDSLAIGAVSARSALGAAVSIGEDGTILYDPTAALQHLSIGQVVADSFDYTIVDGKGGVDVATVSLTVAGRAEAEALV
jgi:VCBS repeat-containing protein